MELPSKLALNISKYKQTKEASLISSILIDFLSSPKLLNHPSRIKFIMIAINEEPKASRCSTPMIYIDRDCAPKAYEEIKNLWISLLDEHHYDPEIVIGTTFFLQGEDKEQSLELIEAALKNSPNHHKLAIHASKFCDNAEDKLKLLLKAEQLGSKQPNLDVWIAKMALEVQKYKLASTYAAKLLSLAETINATHKDNLFIDGNGMGLFKKALEVTGNRANAQELTSDISKYNNHIHWANSILGLIALNDNNNEVALAHLKKSGNVRGNPRLNSYGPCMDLVKKLITIGYFDEAIEYITSCNNFWKKDEFSSWVEALRAKKTPNLPFTQ